MGVRFTDNTKMFENLIKQKVNVAMKEIGITGVAEVMSNTPVKEGILKKSWTFKQANIGNKYKITYGTAINYAPYVEFKPNSSQGFFRRTMRTFSTDAVSIIKKHLREVR